MQIYLFIARTATAEKFPEVRHKNHLAKVPLSETAKKQREINENQNK